MAKSFDEGHSAPEVMISSKTGNNGTRNAQLQQRSMKDQRMYHNQDGYSHHQQ